MILRLATRLSFVLLLAGACGESTSLRDIDSSASFWIWDIQYYQDQWVATGGISNEDFSFSSPVVFTSLDGQSWRQRDVLGSGVLRSIATGHDIFVAVGGELIIEEDGNSIRRQLITVSEDGATWETLANSSTEVVESVAFGNDRFVAASQTLDGFSFQVSLDGRQWSDVATSFQGWSPQVLWTGTEFVVYGEFPGVLTSVDGESWESWPLDITSTRYWHETGGEPVGLAVLDSCFSEHPSCVAGFEVRRTGAGWSLSPTNTIQFSDLASVGEVSVAVGSQSISRLEPPGLWRVIEEDLRVQTIGSNDDLFVVGGRGLAYSTNGESWSVATTD